MSVSIAFSEGLALVTVDNPPVNALSQQVRAGLLSAVAACDKNPDVRGVVLVCRGRTFIAGADVTEFGKPPLEPHLPAVVTAIEEAAKPWVAAIHGSALGGGLEVGMACRFRVALASAQAGLPEVRLGLLPGAGGTVRLPRLVGPELAARMITGGVPISAGAAREAGLFDEVYEDELLLRAQGFLKEALARPLPLPVLARPSVDAPSSFWEEITASVRKRAGREKAPLLALESVRKACSEPTDEALAFERATFLQLRGSEQARALRHVFFAEREATRPPELAGVVPRALTSAAVVGGGTMGAGIAVALRDAGLPVILLERDGDSLQRGMERIREIYAGSLKRGRLSETVVTERLAGIRGTIEHAVLADVDLVVEAVFEDLQVKREVFRRLSEICRQDAILATNTSYLDPRLIVAGMPWPERFIGLHFFSPAQVMKLLEIIPVPETAPDVLAAGFALARRLGKIAVRAGICDGFIGNRILRTLRAQAERLLLAGASPGEVDAAMRDFGMPMGPFEAQDLGGLDIAAFQREAARERGESVFAPVADLLCEQGRLGQKTGAGWYDYLPGDRKPHESPTVHGAIEAARSAHAGLQTGLSWSAETLADCIVLPMINEAAAILEQGIALREADVDLVEVHGYGFPRWRGGLFCYARGRGLQDVVARLRALADAGMAPKPCGRLIRMAREEDLPG